MKKIIALILFAGWSFAAAAQSPQIWALNPWTGTVFELTDIHGKAWKKGIVNDLPLSITELPVGLYLIQLSSGTDSKTIKFIKQ